MPASCTFGTMVAMLVLCTCDALTFSVVSDRRHYHTLQGVSGRDSHSSYASKNTRKNASHSFDPRALPVLIIIMVILTFSSQETQRFTYEFSSSDFSWEFTSILILFWMFSVKRLISNDVAKLFSFLALCEIKYSETLFFKILSTKVHCSLWH